MQRLIRQQRILYLALLSLLCFSLYTVRLGYLQLFRHNKLTVEAVRQRAQAVTLDYNRGDILDRNGISLLGSKKEKILVVFPSLLGKSDKETVEIISNYIPRAALPGNPFIALRDVDAHEEAFFANLSRGLVVTEAQTRYGPKALATHVVGHIGPGDGEGKIGLEFTFNRELSGDSPTMLAAVVDGKNNLIEGLGYRLWESRAVHHPYNIVLTIDSNMQAKVETIMNNTITSGAVVIMDPASGDILAMASRPNYLQYELSRYLGDGDTYGEFLSSQPFINRSILSYPPGSVFKIVVVAAALDTGAAWLGTRFHCPGHIQVGDQIFKCQGGPHGDITLAEAFASSCNSAFIELALKLGRETVHSYAVALGMGEETGIPLGSPSQGGESKGTMPAPQEMPFWGDLALTAIGQGRVEATPLQVARLTSVLANGGYRVEPRLIKELITKQGLLLEKYPPGRKKRVLSPLTASKLRFMMLGVVEHGTGKQAFSSRILLGGKTGTAETGKYAVDRPLVYSWFTGLVPLEDSRAVVTVFVEEPLQGSAAATFKQIAEAIYPYIKIP